MWFSETTKLRQSTRLNSSRNGVYVAPKQICPLAAGKGSFALPVDRPTVTFLTVVPRSTALSQQSTSPHPRVGCSQSVDRAVDRPESRCSLFLGPVDRAVDRWLNGHKNDHWLVDRAVDRNDSFALSWLPTGRFLRGYKYLSLELVSS